MSELRQIGRSFPYMLLGFIFSLALLGPLLSSYEPHAIDLMHLNEVPSWSHWFGTDDLGRDLFVRCCWGARISLFVSIMAAALDLFIGVGYGACAAFFGGKVDECLMRVADILASIPYLLVVILLTVVLGTGLFTVVLALVFTGWVNMARITRGKALEVLQEDYVKASKAFGGSSWHIFKHHIVPNVRGIVVTTATLTIPMAIFSEAYLSFLGLGVQSPAASWGTLAYEGSMALYFYPWRLFFPAMLISVTILSFNWIGQRWNNHFEVITPQ